ncbi:hypothetical protein J8M97_25200 [Gordonia polyisoprenivorans]|uniref:hypothetical protein n=1 Tax=Gordonia polyisoprenivorans TaxID=84595 RepID=UPI00037EA93C|nr:hypothetical protein [Gordonia polyisoprenivorans]QUD82912.1 hypothetical protein J8M97_25200 [Gordonia polyisoprenivorans]
MSTEAAIVLFVAGLILLLALVLGVWKYQQMLTAPDHLAHPYVDIAHRAALMYSFATALLAALVQFSAWPAWLDLVAAGIPIVFFLGAILTYIGHGMRRDTTNQFAHPDRALRLAMAALILGEIGGVTVLLIGFAVGQFG